MNQTAIRKSKTRPTKTMEMKPGLHTEKICTDFLLEKVFPTIRGKFPFQTQVPAFVQQEEYRPYMESNNPSIIQDRLWSGNN